jgi:hypothetical protein
MTMKEVVVEFEDGPKFDFNKSKKMTLKEQIKNALNFYRDTITGELYLKSEFR